MKNAIIIHGMPSKEEYLDRETPSESNKHWIPWIQKQLVRQGVLAQTPEMPEPYHPVYEAWKNVFEQFHIYTESILIGHSCGAGFLLRYLSEQQISVDTVVLIAPWIDPKKSLDTGFFDFLINENIFERMKKLVIYYSLDDDQDILDGVEILKNKLPQAIFKEFTDKGHFVFETMKTNQFPELLEELHI